MPIEYENIESIYVDMKDLYAKSMGCRNDPYNPQKRGEIDGKIERMLESISKMMEYDRFKVVKSNLVAIQTILTKMKLDNLDVLCMNN